ncbi:MAG: hypothetical protein PHW01_02545 [Patescibacteria group bacterium]|nr:hypothetical protein [Patescibacteria group bacterium]
MRFRSLAVAPPTFTSGGHRISANVIGDLSGLKKGDKKDLLFII